MLPELAGKKVLLVSSAGGHLAELLTLATAAGVSKESLWVVPDTPQSRSLLHGQRTMFVPYVGPRAVRAALRAAQRVARVLRRERFDYCVSSGAAIAAFTLPLAASKRIRSIYVESLARADGPSLTGKILRAVPRVRTMTQSQVWASTAWPYAGTVIDDFIIEEQAPPVGPLRVFVTLGTIRPYRFDRAIDAIQRALRTGDEVVWQLGFTSRDGLPGRVYREMTSNALREEMIAADVVIAHAGVGSILDALAAGKRPVLVVRRRSHGEHVDDHQTQIAEMMRVKGLGLELDLSAPGRDTLLDAAGGRVRLTTPHQPSTMRKRPPSPRRAEARQRSSGG